MTIVVSGHQVDIDAETRQNFIEEIRAISDKFQAKMTSGHVIVNRGAHDLGFMCEITVHLPRTAPVNASGDTRGEDINLAFAAAARKLSTQIRRMVRADNQVSHLKLVSGS